MKKKGPKQMAPYAVRMTRAKEIIGTEERLALIRYMMHIMDFAFVIALSDEFGFGADRARKVEKRVDEIIVEFGVLQDGTDTDYALGALERRYRQVIPEEMEHEQEEPAEDNTGGHGADGL